MSTRRDVLRIAGGLALGCVGDQQVPARDRLVPARNAVDHVILGAADLEEGIRLIKEKTGLTPVIGGSHPGVGTRNALLSLGPGHYMEIMAPDPEQHEYKGRFDLRLLKQPQLVGWAAGTADIEALADQARGAGIHVAGPEAGARRKPDGTVLQWRTLSVQNPFRTAELDPVPFFIQWGDGVPHPSRDALTSCRLESLELAHPRAVELRDLLRKLGIQTKVRQSGEARITARLWTPRGKWRIQ
jgi:hypothetical protein